MLFKFRNFYELKKILHIGHIMTTTKIELRLKMMALSQKCNDKHATGLILHYTPLASI